MMPEVMKKEKNIKKEKKEPNLKPAKNSGKYESPLKGINKVSKQLIKDIGKIPPMSATDIEKYLQAIALGIIPDRFGMEPSLDTKINAIKVLKDLKCQNGNPNENGLDSVVIEDDIRPKQSED